MLAILVDITDKQKLFPSCVISSNDNAKSGFFRLLIIPEKLIIRLD